MGGKWNPASSLFAHSCEDLLLQSLLQGCTFRNVMAFGLSRKPSKPTQPFHFHRLRSEYSLVWPTVCVCLCLCLCLSICLPVGGPMARIHQLWSNFSALLSVKAQICDPESSGCVLIGGWYADAWWIIWCLYVYLILYRMNKYGHTCMYRYLSPCPLPCSICSYDIYIYIKKI